MNRMIWQVMDSCVFAVAAFAPAVAQVPNGAQTSLPEMVSSAKTAAEHEKIAAYYSMTRLRRKRSNVPRTMRSCHRRTRASVVGWRKKWGLPSTARN